jgi:hypothetical protein
MNPHANPSPTRHESSGLRAGAALIGRTILLLTILGWIGASGPSALAGTVGYYRFEDGSDGAALPDSGSGVTPGTVPDSSGSGNNLNVYASYTAPTFSANVPVGTIPATGAGNTLSASFSGTQDIYSSEGGGLSSVVFTDFTIEAYVSFNDYSALWYQTIVGRDDTGNPGLGTGAASLFYLSQNGQSKALRVEAITLDNTDISYESSFVPTADIWYHIAAVGDASAGTLSLYVDGALLGSVSGFTGLFDPGVATQWTIGRGQYGGSNVDNFHGSIDEVRFSDTALTPSEFLNVAAVPEPGSGTLMLIGGGLGLLLLRKRRRQA